MKLRLLQRARALQRLEACASAGVIACLIACAASAPTPNAATRATSPAASPTTQPQPASSGTRSPSTPDADAPETPAAQQHPGVEGGIGTPGPVTLRAASATASFAALCQAREDTDGDGKVEVRVGEHGQLHGDNLQVYLVRGSGAGQRVDEYVGHDPTGRYVAAIRGQELVLVDLALGRDVVLSQGQTDVRDDAASFYPHRAGAFSPVAPWFAYLVRTDTGPRVVLRDLTTGSETRHDPGDGSIWRLAFEPDGAFLRVELITKDTNRNGRLDWPYPRALRPNRCMGPIPTFAVWDYPGDRPTTKLLRLSTLDWIEPDGFVMTMGDGWIARSGSELWLWSPDAAATRISSESCAGRVLHADARYDHILFGCASGWGQRRQLYYRTQRERRALGFDVAGYELDGRLDPAQRLIALRSRDASYLIDLALRRTSELKQGSEVLATYDSHALIAYDDKLMALHWPDTGSPTWLPLGVPRPSLVELQQQGAFVAVGTSLFDLASRGYAGEFERQPLQLALDGRGLLPVHNQTAQRFAEGPLMWTAAETR